MSPATIKGIAPFIGEARYPDVLPEVVFFRQAGNTVIDTRGSDKLLNKETSDAIQWGTQKDLQQPAGAYSVTLVPRLHNYLEDLVPGDWCEITADINDSKGKRLLMYGPISSITQSTSVDQRGAYHTTVSVEGADFGKAVAGTVALLDAALGKSPVIGMATVGQIAKNVHGDTGGETPTTGRILKEIIKHWYSESIDQCYNPRTKQPFTKLLNLDWIDVDILGQAAWQPMMLATPLWQVIQQWSNPAYCETFMDYRPPKTNPSDLVHLEPSVVHRRHPLFGADWDNLTTVEVLKTEVVHEQMTRSDADVRNWIRVLDEQNLSGLESGVLGVQSNIGYMVPESLKRFGIRRFEPQTNWCYDVANAKTNPQHAPMSIVGLLENYTTWAAIWHHSNERLYYGSISTYLRPDIRVGYKLAYIDTETKRTMHAYIESVQHSYAYPGQMTTTVHFTRGRYTDDKDKRFTWYPSVLKQQGVIVDLGSTAERLKGKIG